MIGFGLRNVTFRREMELPVRYKDRILPCAYRADFVCFDEIIVEAKALSAIRGPEQAQVINYLKATGFSLGLLLNFGASRLEYKRLILSHHLRPSVPSADESVSSAIQGDIVRSRCPAAYEMTVGENQWQK